MEKLNGTLQSILAIIITVFGCGYIAYVTIATIPAANQRIVDTCIGFVLGTLLSTILNFYWGSSKGSSDKTKLLSAQPSAQNEVK